ncbi:MAG: GNAT family N-acetyltransferase [Bacilli bacterium]
MLRRGGLPAVGPGTGRKNDSANARILRRRPSRETNRYINISNVYTDPGYRGRGYMQALILHVCKLIQDAGKTPSLYVDVANPISSRVYKKVGFRSI